MSENLTKHHFQEAPLRVTEDEFTSGDKFVFEQEPEPSSGRMTRSRRSSICMNSAAPAPAAKKSRRQTMLPTVSEQKIARGGAKVEAVKQTMALSPTKKFSKSSTKVLTDDDILTKLESTDTKPEGVKRTSASKKTVKSRSPQKSRIPVKSPVSPAKTKPRRSRRVSGDVISPQTELKPSSSSRKPTRLPTVAESEVKLSPQKSKSSVDVIKDVKKVEIKLKQMKIKEDPNLIFSMLEESFDMEDRVNVVVDQIVETKKDNSPLTRASASSLIKKENVETKALKKKGTKTPQKKETKPPKKLDVKTPKKKETKTPIKSESKASKKDESKPPKIIETGEIKEEKQTPKPKESVKLMMKEEPSSKKRKQTATPAIAAPVQNKRLKLDKSTSKTPDSSVKPNKLSPGVMEKYKQRTPAGSLRKPLKRLSNAKFTPAQVKPSDVLRRNMIKKVETKIIAKMNNKPNSSPYTLKSGENSPVFTKVEKVKPSEHITGTPVRSSRGRLRKFGTSIQPSSSLLEASVAPGTETIKRVSSSTPVRPRPGEPHPLEAVEATPIRPPTFREAPLSPPPEMVTGKLGSLCSIM